MIFACATNNGGVVNAALSWKPFAPLSKLTYGVYLFHVQVLQYCYPRQNQLDSPYTLLYINVLVLVMTYALALIFYLALEVPILKQVKTVNLRNSVSLNPAINF